MTENERKYVINLNCEEAVKAVASSSSEVWQGYLFGAKGCTFRVRSMTTKKGKLEYFFTFKVTTKGRVIEVEDYIDERDFKDLWSLALSKLEKTRYKLNGEYKGWVIDFFRDHNNHTYFAMAECEMPEGQVNPDVIPDVIDKNLVFEVPINDDRFCSKMLSDVRYAQNILREIHSER